jgi:hypothetical protein
MKLFKTCLLAASVAALASTGAAAQSYNFEIINTPDSVKNAFGVAINDQGLVTLNAETPRAAELDFSLIPAIYLLESGVPAEFDPETDSLTYEQYYRLISRFPDRRNASTLGLRLATKFAAEYDGQTVSMPPLLNTDGNGASSQLNSGDHEFRGLNNNNVRVGIGSAPYYRVDHTYQPEPEEGEETPPDPITLSYAERDFTSRGIWYDGTTLKLIEPLEQTILGGESALFDINEQNAAAGFMSVGLTPTGSDRIDTCLTIEGDPSASNTVYNCVWRAWFGIQNGTTGFFGTGFRTNASIYEMRATVWQLDAQGEVLSHQTYEPLMERREDDLEGMGTYAFALNNNNVAVGQSWTYLGSEAENNLIRARMPAIFVNGETRAVTSDSSFTWGAAVDINDDNLAIGFLLKRFVGVNRAVPFIYNVDTAEFNELPTFFTGSATYPNAISNQGIVVGSAEIESSLNAPRRRVGFIYDLNNPEQGLINLNDAIGCRADYFIVSADGINAQNQIVATATTEKEITDEAGVVHTEQVTTSLLIDADNLAPVENCSEEKKIIERQGAATSPGALLAMLLIGGLITIRRKFKA